MADNAVFGNASMAESRIRKQCAIPNSRGRNAGIRAHMAILTAQRTHRDVIGCRRLDSHGRRVVQRGVGSTVTLCTVGSSGLNVGVRIRQRWHGRIIRRRMTIGTSHIRRWNVIVGFDLGQPLIKSAVAT